MSGSERLPIPACRRARSGCARGGTRAACQASASRSRPGSKGARSKVAGDALHTKQDRPDEQTEDHKQRNRIAWGAEKGRVADPAKCQGFTGPNGDFPKTKFTQFLHRRFDVILFPNGNATAGNYEVCMLSAPSESASIDAGRVSRTIPRLTTSQPKLRSSADSVTPLEL